MKAFFSSFIFMFAVFGMSARSETVSVAVAANFYPTALALAKRYEAAAEREGLDGVDVQFISGSSGKLFAQIVQGAPFDIFLSADQRTPRRLETLGLSVDGSRFTYAEGVLVLAAKNFGDSRSVAAALTSENLKRVSMAQPKIAPYGRAAVQVLEKLGLSERLSAQTVYGENVAQAFRFYTSNNVSHAFVPLSYVIHRAELKYISIPSGDYEPILQDAVLIARARNNTSARDFLTYLRSAEASDILLSHGYRKGSVQ